MPRSTNQTRPAPRKAPKQARSLETVAVIVEAAARILEERGHDGFSTNAVAERAGVSVGSLYQYFPSKDALIGALVVRETSLLVEDTKKACAQSTGQAALSAFIAACIAHQFRRPQLARLLDYEEARLPFDADTQRVGRQIHELVIEMLAKSDLPALEDPDLTARETVAIIKGIIDAAGQHGDADTDALAGRVQRAAFGYLAIGPG
ncbi:MAG TPA: TetR/AcrR family transcriptional regulator [Rhodopila sp.]|jgi:AcrR family transcriptional regulator|nr:TetR/AcrR family transcriptional regulator [Rhodopila sp.]